MLSLPKIALFSLISFATLALAITAPEPRSVNARALFTAANVQIVNTMYPIDSSTFISFSSTLLYTYGLRIAYVTPSNNTAANIGPILTEVTSIVNKFIIALKGSNLDCSAQEILELAADLIKAILDPLSSACGSNSDILRLVGSLVVAIVDLIQVVLELVNSFATKLLALLIGNGCAGIIVKLGLTDLIKSLGIAQTVGNLLIGLSGVLSPKKF